MSRYRELDALQTTPVATPVIPGLIRSLEDAQTNTHPYPILFHPLWFRTLCIECGAVPIGPQRSTLQAALADRITHSESHS